MKMKARIRLVIEEEFDFDVEEVNHDTLPYQIDNFRSLSKAEQQKVHKQINAREEEVLKTRVNAAKHAEKLAKGLVPKGVKVVDMVVEEVTQS